jgi:hypothetical protein
MRSGPFQCSGASWASSRPSSDPSCSAVAQAAALLAAEARPAAVPVEELPADSAGEQVSLVAGMKAAAAVELPDVVAAGLPRAVAAAV